MFNVTSGRVDTANKRNITFGRVEVTAKLQDDATASGIHTAAWLLGYDCWPRGGEIDIQECQSPRGSYAACAARDVPSRVSANYHYGPACGADIHHNLGPSSYPLPHGPPVDFSAGFTTFAVEWNATSITTLVNDTVIFRVYDGMPGWAAPFVVPTWPMFLILSQAYMKQRPCGDPTSWPVLQLIDSVRVYRAA